MKRELAFAIEARSHFDCFSGRTRSSRSSSSPGMIFDRKITRSAADRKLIDVDDGVDVGRRRKKVKTEVKNCDFVESPAPEVESTVVETEVVTVEVELAAEEVAMEEVELVAEEECPAVEVKPAVAEDVVVEEVATEEEELAKVKSAAEEEELTAEEKSVENGGGGRVTEKVYVKRKKRKNNEGTSSNTPKRFTRSALKDEKVKEDVGKVGSPIMKKLELKMSKKIGLERMPTNARELLETGLLEGFRVFYKLDNERSNLQGLIKGLGILCSCNLCNGTKIISISQFEMHARKSYRHAIKHICLENGKSLLEVIEICKSSAMETLEVALQAVISSLPAKGPSICTNCNGSIEASLTDNLLMCDTCLNKRQVQVQSIVATPEDVSTSSPVSNAKSSISLSTYSDNKSRRGRKTNTSSPVPDTLSSNSVSVLSDNKNRRGRKRKSSVPVLKSPESATKYKLSQNKINSKVLKRALRSASVPRAKESASRCTSSQQKSRPKLTSKNQHLHWAVFEKGGLPDGTELTYVAQGKKLLEGYKLGRGIFCSCCKTEISASQFEAHAGRASHKKPYENIYTSNGVSLHEYSVSLKMNENRKCPVSSNDNLCTVCMDGGDLLLCDGCPRSFHQECVDVSSIPRGKWYCRYCEQAMKYVGDSANAVAAGRVTGIDSIEQIMTRCIRIVKNAENNDLVACVLCRCHDFSKTVFNDRTVIVCDQCEREYHIGCLREHNMADLKELPKGKWFCCTACERIHSVMKNLLTRESKILPDDLLDLVKEKQMNNEVDNVANSEMRFILLRGKDASRETRKLLAQTVDIFHEGFDPIIDATSGRDFIPSMVYGRKIWSQDFAGMLCAILTKDSNVITAGTLRVFGEDIAELPIVATSKCNKGKGYFKLLFTCIERLLSSLKIKKIVLPAAEEAKSIWTNKFGFETIDQPQLDDLRQTCSTLMTFKGTYMLQKEIPQALNGVPGVGDEFFQPSVE
uniref:uncharacterized protein LOC122582862 n=1 Tax=Erigeron canadensis TaxID=72917 RepID=UPI001CB964A2|nr:uncharacterized protein LOC122582862 [Erigeron canadensis]